MRQMKTMLGVFAMTGAALSLAFAPKLDSGVAKGEKLVAFEPHHVTGANKNSDTCPVCMYPTNPAVQVWVNGDDEKNVGAIVSTLEKATTQNAGKKFKAFVIFVNPQQESAAAMNEKLAKMGASYKVKNVALAYLPGPKEQAVSDYKINTSAEVKNTVFVYNARTVDTKFVNFVADEKGLQSLKAAIQDVVSK